MSSLRTALLLLASTLPLAACVSNDRTVIADTPAPIARAPQPPAGAATTLTIPNRLADGSFETPNRALSDAGTLWHLRAALNVAALQCDNGVSVPDYNRFLATQKRALADAHRELAAEYRIVHGPTWQASFDGAMTRLYNYFALPPVRDGFCRATAAELANLAAAPTNGAASLAPAALDRIEASFLTFFRNYADYRQALAQWRANDGAIASTPRLGYHTAIFDGADTVTGGARRLASR